VPTYSEILSFWESGHIPYFPPVEIKSKGGKFFGLPIEGFVAMQLATPKVFTLDKFPKMNEVTNIKSNRPLII